jgi:hypothetical protein
VLMSMLHMSFKWLQAKIATLFALAFQALIALVVFGPAIRWTPAGSLPSSERGQGSQVSPGHLGGGRGPEGVAGAMANRRRVLRGRSGGSSGVSKYRVLCGILGSLLCGVGSAVLWLGAKPRAANAGGRRLFWALVLLHIQPLR